MLLQSGHLHYGHDWANDKTAAVFRELSLEVRHASQPSYSSAEKNPYPECIGNV